MCTCVCGGTIDSQMSEQILMKLCRHYSWVPTMVFHPKKLKISWGGGGRGGRRGKEEFQFSI